MLIIWLLWCVTIVVMDLRIRKVRNWMVLLGLGLGSAALLSGAQPLGVSTLSALGGMLVAFAALLPFYAIRWMGAGDVKFAAVMGLWFGLSPNLLFIWIGGSLLAAVHGMTVLAWRSLQAGPLGDWLQAHLPAPLFTMSAMAATANANPRVTATAAASGKRQIERSIPYAGYMAVTAIWLVMMNTGSAS